MKKNFSVLLILVLLVGCASAHSRFAKKKTPLPLAAPVTAPLPVSPGKPPVVSPSPTVKPVAVEKSAPPIGTIFAKTVFEGVVKTSYVQLSIVDRADPSKVYELYIGDKARQMSYPWNMQTVSPGYFFIDLPVGEYRIQSLTIPVGTTLATEPMDITFAVKENRAVYLGTLKVMGINEKIKLGGVPIIRPGFDYAAQVVDERVEAVLELRSRFPKEEREIVFDLMRLHAVSNVDSAPSSAGKSLITGT